MITFPKILGPDGQPLVRQVLTHPSVYLDTWALRLFAEDDPASGKRFRNALLKAGGSLVLSDLSLIEFTFDDPRHAAAVGRYVDQLGSHLFFSRYDPFKVIEAEIAVMVGQTSESPAGDVQMLILYAEAAEKRGAPTVVPWFSAMHAERSHMAAVRDAMAREFIRGLALLRKRFASEPGFAKSALRDIRQSTRPRSTQALLRALLYLLRNQPFEPDINDARDILHCIVPAAYCDFVLLDRTWYAQMNQARKFLERCGIETRIAQQFRRQGGGVEQFLTQLESLGTVSPHP